MNTRFPIILFLTSLIPACSYLPEALPDEQGLEIREDRHCIEIHPGGGAGFSPTGLLLYPGGLVDPHAYMDLAASFALSGRGHRVVIAKMPANLAVLNSGAAKKITSSIPMEQWVIGGHSLGGAMACSMVRKEEGNFEGLILMAAYPSSSSDLSSWKGSVLSITASEDRVVDPETFEEAMERLPPSTSYLEIDGGNHAGFASYGPQKGDGDPAISAEEQQQEVVQMLQNFYDAHALE